MEALKALKILIMVIGFIIVTIFGAFAKIIHLLNLNDFFFAKHQKPMPIIFIPFFFHCSRTINLDRS